MQRTSTTLTYGDAIAPFLAAGWPEAALRPLVPPRAKLTPGSKLPPAMVGKIPGRWDGHAWSGMVGWQRRVAPEAIERVLASWHSWPTGNVGVLANVVQCADCDVEDAETSATIEDLLREAGEDHGPGLRIDVKLRRREGSHRWAAPMVDLIKQMPPVAFTREGRLLGLLEFKISGHWVIAGEHPKGGRYYWPEGIPEVDLTTVDDGQDGGQ